MLEVCPTVASDKPRIEVHPLSIGGKSDPARLVLKAKRPCNCRLLADMGDRFRLIINEAEAIEPVIDMPKLPVARVLWKPKLFTLRCCEGVDPCRWCVAKSFSYAVTTEHMLDWAEMAGIEVVLINDETNLRNFKEQLIINDYVWRAQGQKRIFMKKPRVQKPGALLINTGSR